MIADLESKISIKVKESHGRLIDLVLDALLKTDCSYAKHLYIYQYNKLSVHRLNKRLTKEAITGLEFTLIESKLRYLKGISQDTRKDMYSKPCKTCHYCLNRIKPWPDLV